MRRITWLLAVSAALSACVRRDEGDEGGAARPGWNEGGDDGTPGDVTDEAARTGVGLVEIADGFTAPIALVEDDQGDLWVADQVGIIHRIRGDRLDDAPMLDLSDRIVPLVQDDPRGLLGFALHPQFAQNGLFYAFYTTPAVGGLPRPYDHTNVLAEFRYDRTAERVDDARRLLAFPHPGMGHNGGTIAFGPDGYLYLSIGDGGGASDGGSGHPPLGNGQNVQTLYGSILRMDVDAEGRQPVVPPDNPFYQSFGKGAIWAYGFRDPHGLSFDGDTGGLWVVDRGQDLMEEVDVVEKGGNYGWNVMEGFFCFDPADPLTPLPRCAEVDRYGEPLRDPVVAYLQTPHTDPTGERFDPVDAPGTADYLQLGLDAIGGFVYRGTMLQEHVGHYVFASRSNDVDVASGKLLMVEPMAAGQFEIEPFVLDDFPGRVDVPPDEGGAPGEEAMYEEGVLPYYVLGLGEGVDGELYVLTSETGGPRGNTGRVFRLATVEVTGPGEGPEPLPGAE